MASIARKTHRSELDHRASPSRILDPESISQLRRIFATTARVSGSTHKFYLYPARFPPDVANEIIRSFSRKGEWILDPFMGGGTSAVEALTLGRQMLGSDINALAKFVADVRTRPLSPMDQSQVRLWATTTADRLTQHDLSWVPIAGIVNLPNEAETFFAGALELARNMLPRRRAFARGVLLRLGQLTLDCRDCVAPNREHLAVRLLTLVEQMFSGLDELVESCRASGVPQNAITGRRLLLDRSAIGLEEDRRIQHLGRAPTVGIHISSLPRRPFALSPLAIPRSTRDFSSVLDCQRCRWVWGVTLLRGQSHTLWPKPLLSNDPSCVHFHTTGHGPKRTGCANCGFL